MSSARPPTFALGLVAALTGCQPPANQTTGAADAVRAADIAWEKAFSSKNPAGAAAFVESTGSILPPNAPIATGPAAVRALFDGFYACPRSTSTGRRPVLRPRGPGTSRIRAAGTR
jgi:hypothetical protein